jgi:hypothetical protein
MGLGQMAQKDQMQCGILSHGIWPIIITAVVLEVKQTKKVIIQMDNWGEKNVRY